MVQGRRTTILFSLLAFVSVTCIVACSDTSGSARGPSSSIERGRIVAERVGCSACHVIGAASDTRYEASAPLAGIAQRTFIAGVLANTPANLARWIYDPQAVKPRTSMPKLIITAQDATDISAYLYSLH